jgi:hypothetical protein
MGHGPAFCELKGTTAEGSRAANRLCKNVEFLEHGAGVQIPTKSPADSEMMSPGDTR